MKDVEDRGQCIEMVCQDLHAIEWRKLDNSYQEVGSGLNS